MHGHHAEEELIAGKPAIPSDLDGSGLVSALASTDEQRKVAADDVHQRGIGLGL